MRYEKSCGAVVFRNESGEREYLLEHMVQGHYAHCKGHVEKGETEKETAVREIREETGLSVRFLDGFREMTEYSPGEGVYKEVVYFLAEKVNGEEKAQLSEVSGLLWASYEEARELLTYPNDRELLDKAEAFLEKQCNTEN